MRVSCARSPVTVNEQDDKTVSQHSFNGRSLDVYVLRSETPERMTSQSRSDHRGECKSGGYGSATISL
jgi:hypothetical protein